MGSPIDSSESVLSVIDDIAGALAADPIEGIHEAAGRLAEALQFTRCTIIAYPGDEESLGYVVGASDDPTLSKLPLDLRLYPELRVAIERREVVFVEDAASSALLGEHAPAAAQHGGRTLLVLPLLADRRPLGCLFLRSTAGRPPLDERQRFVASLAARVFAASLGGGKVHETLREQTRRLSLATYEEQRRRLAIEQHRDFFEGSADGVVVVDREGVVLYVNRAAEQMTGYARSGLQGRRIHEIVFSSQHEGLVDVIAQASAGVRLAGFDLQLLTTSREPLCVSVSASAAFEEHNAVVLTFRDVTVARSLETELRKTKDFLERLINSAVDGIVAADLRGNVMVFSQGASRIYGYSAEEVIGKIPVWQLYPEGEARRIMAELRSPDWGGSGRLEPSRREVLSKERERVPVTLTASIIYEDAREVASVGILSDLRERLKIERSLAQAEEKLVESEKQALLAELAGTTAHELNQPLTSVMGYAELLKKRLAPDDKHARAVEIILREAERMAEIVRKIGKITRYETKNYVGSTNILDLEKSTQ